MTTRDEVRRILLKIEESASSAEFSLK